MALPSDPASLWFLVTVLALAGLAIFAYAVRALDLWGSIASFLLGLLVAILGGIEWMLLMVTFTGLGFIATRIGYGTKKRRRVAEEAEGERGIRNVLGNGAAAGLIVLVVLAEPHVSHLAIQLAFVTALAAVAADTLASELGVLAPRARNILPPFDEVHVGDNGGVSWAGQASAAVGSLLISASAVALLGIPIAWAWVPALAGFVGCQIDSILGAAFEGEASRPGPLGKQDVNFLASLLPAAAVLLAFAWWP